ncbi:MAG: hypothetical protein FWE72_09710 [Spirochaetaceae bacterium]|nr:hypothetical protein [Spirochaetaceae bacterium]
MFKRKIYFFAVIIISVFLIAGCQTTTKTDEDVPEWVKREITATTSTAPTTPAATPTTPAATTPVVTPVITPTTAPTPTATSIPDVPVHVDYFMGVGFSNTGNEADDLNNAKKKAFSDLALVIFEHIKKSQQYLLPPNADAKYFDSAEAHIIQSLTRNFTDIETDFYYSADNKGYWFYYKISKIAWEKIEKEEHQEIADFIEEVLSPKLSSKEISDVEILSFLLNGWKFIAESPYPELVRGNLDNDNGLLINLIENNIAKVFSRLVINIEPDHISTEPGLSQDVIVSVTDKEGRRTGEFKIDFFRKTDGKKVAEITTKKDGRYSGKVEFKNLPVGKQQVYAEISMPHIEINPKLFKKEIDVPFKDFTVTVNEVSVVLKLVLNGEAEIDNFIEQTKSLFSKEELAIRLSPGHRDERYTIVFTINFRNQPKNFHNLFITNANATVELLKEDSYIFSYKSQEYREVGLDWARAQERVSIKMFKDINNDELFFKEMYKAIYSELIIE